MSEEKDRPLWVKEREYVLMQDEGVAWRYDQRPDYSRTNSSLAKERKFNHADGTLDAIVHNLVKTFEMEASFKTKPQQWLSIVENKFRMSTNGGKEYTAQEIVDEGTYNLFLGDSKQYKASEEDFDSSYNVFHTAFPDGFHWELVKVLSGPPNVIFKWRHWGTFNGPYKENKSTGEVIEMTGLSIAEVTEELKIERIEHFFDTHKFLTKLAGE